MPETMEIFCFPNGTYAVTGSAGQQMTELQGAWLRMIAERIQSAGHNPCDATIHLPDGKTAKFFEYEVDGEKGINWRIL